MHVIIEFNVYTSVVEFNLIQVVQKNCTYAQPALTSTDGCLEGQILLSESDGETLYLFDHIPWSLNDACDGSVTEYCYRYNGLLAGYNVTFNLTVVILNSGYTILHVFYAISQASRAVSCIDEDQNNIKCCDITSINAFYLPMESFAFGVTASDESEANLLAYHESATSKTLMVGAIRISKAGMNLAKGSTDLQRFKGSHKEQITPRCVRLIIKSSASSDYLLTTLPVNTDNVTTTKITTNTGSIPKSQESLNLLEIIVIVALLGLCIITTLIIIFCLFLLVIRLEKRANLCRQCVETLRKGRKVDPYGQVHHDEYQISQADSSMEQ